VFGFDPIGSSNPIRDKVHPWRTKLAFHPPSMEMEYSADAIAAANSIQTVTVRLFLVVRLSIIDLRMPPVHVR
jgi:hypothetical protein